jgi:hypothetical protein
MSRAAQKEEGAVSGDTAPQEATEEAGGGLARCRPRSFRPCGLLGLDGTSAPGIGEGRVRRVGRIDLGGLPTLGCSGGLDRKLCLGSCASGAGLMFVTSRLGGAAAPRMRLLTMAPVVIARRGPTSGRGKSRGQWPSRWSVAPSRRGRAVRSDNLTTDCGVRAPFPACREPFATSRPRTWIASARIRRGNPVRIEPGQSVRSASAARAAAMVRSMSAEECAAPMNAASNCDGGQ